MNYLGNELNIKSFVNLSDDLTLAIRLGGHRLDSEKLMTLRKLKAFEQYICCTSRIAEKATDGVAGLHDTCIHMLALYWIEDQAGCLPDDRGGGNAHELHPDELAKTEDRLLSLLRLERLQVLAAMKQSDSNFAPARVTVIDVAEMTGWSLDKIRDCKDEWPPPAIEHSGRRAAEWDYATIHTTLERQFPEVSLPLPRQT